MTDSAPGEGLSDEELDVWRDIAKPMGAEGMIAPVLRTLFARMDTAESSVAALRERDQQWVDQVCYYRNLAIMRGAHPLDMLSAYDRDLCENWVDDDPQSVSEVAEIIDLWAENDALRERAEVAEHCIYECVLNGDLTDEAEDIANRYQDTLQAALKEVQ